MKPLIKVLSHAVVAAMAYFTLNHASAQQEIASWDTAMNGPGGPSLTAGGGTPPAPYTNNTAFANVIVTPMTKGSGIGAITTSAVYGGNSWTNAGIADSEANSIANGLYITYAIQAAPGYTISFSTNEGFIHMSSTGPGSGELQYSTDGVNYSDLLPVTYNGNTVFTNNLSGIAALQNVPSTTTNYFRLVNWGATSTAGTWYIYNPTVPAGTLLGTTNEFVIFGSVTPEPAAQNLATWDTAMNGPGGPSLTDGGGTPPAPYTNNTAAANIIVTPMTKGSGIGAITTSAVYGGNSWTNAGIADSEANSIANGLYITYAIQAATNYTISFYTNEGFIHMSSTGPGSAELQYSTDGVNYIDLLPVTYNGNTVFTNNLSTFNFLQNVPSTTTNYFRLVNWGATSTGGTWYIYNPTVPAGTLLGTTNEFVIAGGVTSIFGVLPPTNALISPTSETVNAGQGAGFTASDSDGAQASYSWYQISNSVPLTTNLLSDQTNSSLALTSVLAANSGGYFAILTNSSGSSTTAVATLTVQNDPIIQVEPNYTYGLVDGTVYFSVAAFGTGPIGYQWYFTDASGDMLAPVNPGSTTASGAVIYGAGTSTLSISNVQTADLTNFVVVISNIYGSQTSSVAGILAVTNVYDLDYPSPFYEYLPPVTPFAFWDFNGIPFTNTTVNPTATADPVPYLGAGTASPVGTCNDPGTSPFAGAVDGSDGAGFDIIVPSLGDHLPNNSWGTDNYPLVGSNKLNGVQFNASTVGAKNVLLEYDSRVSPTASDYERVQYTTNGTTWIDYPSSSTFNGEGDDWITYTNDFSGFPGVANNPNFGVRIVTEVQETATYGVITTNGPTGYLGTANSYTSGGLDGFAAGTVTYDLVGLYGDAITNNNQPPVISAFTNEATGLTVTNETTLDNVSLTNTFYVSGDTTANKFTYSAISLNPSTVNPTFEFTSNVDGTCTMTIIPSSIAQSVAAAPILVSVTDTNGDVTKSWFLLTLTTVYLPPTNTLTQIPETNTLANKALTIPFMVGSQSNATSQLTYETNSDNNTVLPATNIVITGQGTANPSVTFGPGSNELGVALVSVTVNDNNLSDPKFTTATIPFMVRPNTNVLFVDYFNYDQSGPLDEIGAFWTHLSGTFHFMTLNSSPTGGSVLVDTANNTENLEVPLLGAPYATNATPTNPTNYVTTLYYSMVINMEANDTPNSNGTYFAAFNDGSGITADVEGLLLAATNLVAPGDFGDYQVGVADEGATEAGATMFNQDLVPGSNYTVVVSLNLSNGVSTVWVNPSSQSSPSASAPADGGTIKYNISDFELRQSGNESGDIAGGINVSYLKVGTTFDSVFPSLHVTPAGTNTIITWSDPTLGIQETTNLLTTPFADIPSASPPYTNNASTNSVMFYRFGR